MPPTTKATSQGFSEYTNNQAIPRKVWVMIQCISGPGWVATLYMCLVDEWEWSETPGMYSIHMDALHPGHRPSKMWAQV